MGTMNNRRSIIKVYELYYIQNKSQKETLAILGISRPQICRLIIAAKETGIVSISISDPYAREAELENRPIRYFGIRNALVVDSICREGENRMQSSTKEVSRLVEDYIPQDARVGVISRYTCKAMIDTVEQSPKKLKLVVPPAGEMSTINMNIHVDIPVQRLVDLHGTSTLNLNAPAVVSDLNLAVSLRKEESIAKVLEAGKEVDIALVGIGNLGEEATNIQLSNLRKQDADELRRQGATASMCSFYLDKDGCEVGQEIPERSIGQSLKDLKKSRAIAATIGDPKVEVTKAVLKSGKMDILVTGLETVEQIRWEEES